MNLSCEWKSEVVAHEHPMSLTSLTSLDSSLWPCRINRCLLASLIPPCYTPRSFYLSGRENLLQWGKLFSFECVPMFELHSWKCPDLSISTAKIGTCISRSLSSADLTNNHHTLSIKTQHNLRILLTTTPGRLYPSVRAGPGDLIYMPCLPLQTPWKLVLVSVQ